MKKLIFSKCFCLLTISIFYAQTEDLKQQRTMETLVNRGQNAQIPLPSATNVEDQLRNEASRRNRTAGRDKLIKEVNKKNWFRTNI